MKKRNVTKVEKKEGRGWVGGWVGWGEEEGGRGACREGSARIAHTLPQSTAATVDRAVPRTNRRRKERLPRHLAAVLLVGELQAAELARHTGRETALLGQLMKCKNEKASCEDGGRVEKACGWGRVDKACGWGRVDKACGVGSCRQGVWKGRN